MEIRMRTTFIDLESSKRKKQKQDNENGIKK